MGLPQDDVILTPAEVAEVNRMLSELRHGVNNHLTLITTALELMRRKPDALPRMIENLAEQPRLIQTDVSRFSAQLEAALRITRDAPSE